MHIPDHMLNPGVEAATAIVSVAGVAASGFFAFKSKEKPSPVHSALLHIGKQYGSNKRSVWIRKRM